LKPNAPVVEMTSGNMGAGLAVVCTALGHPLVVQFWQLSVEQEKRLARRDHARVCLIIAKP
jgi:cysteine synthase A